MSQRENSLDRVKGSARPYSYHRIWDSSSTQMTLMIMLAAVVVFLPIVIAYTGWVYYVLRGSVTEAAIERGDDYHY
jgi:cytochrome d ubiquinol oxidase subunit II